MNKLLKDIVRILLILAASFCIWYCRDKALFCALAVIIGVIYGNVMSKKRKEFKEDNDNTGEKNGN